MTGRCDIRDNQLHHEKRTPKLFIKNAYDVGQSWTLVDQVSNKLASVSGNYQSGKVLGNVMEEALALQLRHHKVSTVIITTKPKCIINSVWDISLEEKTKYTRNKSFWHEKNINNESVKLS